MADRIETTHIHWPDWNKFRIDVTVENTTVCIAVNYGDKNASYCVDVPDTCVSIARYDLFTVDDCKVYLRWVEICYTKDESFVKGQVWAESGPFRTKLGEFDIHFMVKID